MAKVSIKIGNVPSLPGKMKSKSDHSSFKLFCNGDPERKYLSNGCYEGTKKS